MEEEWRSLPGYESQYEVSSHGRFRTLARPGTHTRILPPGTWNNGYQRVALCRDGERRTASLHRLVALAFHGEPPTLSSVVRHLNGDRADNRSANLAWGSRSENEADKNLHGTSARKARCRWGHALSGENAGRYPDGRRYCKECNRFRARNRQRRRRGQPVEERALPTSS